MLMYPDYWDEYMERMGDNEPVVKPVVPTAPSHCKVCKAQFTPNDTKSFRVCDKCWNDIHRVLTENNGFDTTKP